MANFIAVLDHDPERRQAVGRTLSPELPLVDRASSSVLSLGDLDVFSAQGPESPVSHVVDDSGLSIVWGDAIRHGSAERSDATQIRTTWSKSAGNLPVHDGFHAALVYHPEQGLSVVTDLLGWFPIYYWSQGDTLLVATSPELFRHHPLFRTDLDRAGLVGILLTNGLFRGRTLWQGVRRLGPGRILRWRPRGSVSETLQYDLSELGESDRLHHLGFDGQLEHLHQTLVDSMSRHAPPGGRYSLLLSGGLDSRTLGGLMQRNDNDFTALTFGRKSDLEMHCARRVARALGIEHVRSTIPAHRYPGFAERIVRWEHLANGCNHITGLGWGLQSEQDSLPERNVSGASLDLVLGGRGLLESRPYRVAPETYLSGKVHGWAFTPDQLRPLLRRDIFGDLVDTIAAEVRLTYDRYSGDSYRRALCFDLHHRQRFHTGSFAGWQPSHTSWPVLPVLDRELLRTAFALPRESIAKRRLQVELLRRRFPNLARLPVDRNSFSTHSLIPDRSMPVLAVDTISRYWRRFRSLAGHERRFYYRVFDPDNHGWRAVRRCAEPYRKNLSSLFVRSELDRVLPRPESRVRVPGDRIVDTSKLKLLLGLALWTRDNRV